MSPLRNFRIRQLHVVEDTVLAARWLIAFLILRDTMTCVEFRSSENSRQQRCMNEIRFVNPNTVSPIQSLTFLIELLTLMSNRRSVQVEL